MELSTIKNRIIFIAAMIIMGSLAGAAVWVFFFVMDIGLELIWQTLPRYLSFPFLPLVICLFGGFAIGLHHKKFGDYPETLDTVLTEVKKNNRYEYKNIVSYSTAALLPLIFGGSIGPEAGLTGTIAGLCTWVGDRMKRFGSEFQAMTQMGVSAALSAVFMAPLFGVVAPALGSTYQAADKESGNPEKNFTLPKTWRIVVYLCAIAGAMGIFFLLNGLVGRQGGLPHFKEIEYGITELLWTIPLIAAGAAAGWMYHIFDGLALRINTKLGDRPIIKALIGGALLGGMGILLPYTMFTGETQIFEITELWPTMSLSVLFLTAFFKLFITAYCIRSGWRGGHFFPAIFCAIALGLAFASISGADPVFCMCACAGALVGCLTKQPLLTILLLFLCFPIKGVLVMIIAAAIGAAIPLPKAFQQHVD